MIRPTLMLKGRLSQSHGRHKRAGLSHSRVIKISFDGIFDTPPTYIFIGTTYAPPHAMEGWEWFHLRNHYHSCSINIAFTATLQNHSTECSGYGWRQDLCIWKLWIVHNKLLLSYFSFPWVWSKQVTSQSITEQKPFKCLWSLKEKQLPVRY